MRINNKKLKNRLTTGTFALLIALLAVVSATYAWYVYNTGRHTTKVRMAAGAVGEVSEIAPEDISDGEDVGSQEAEEILNDGETSVEQPDTAWMMPATRLAAATTNQTICRDPSFCICGYLTTFFAK